MDERGNTIVDCEFGIVFGIAVREDEIAAWRIVVSVMVNRVCE